MKKHNPTIPIMLREANGTLPKVYARYEFGQEKSQSLEGTHARIDADTTIRKPINPTLLHLLEGEGGKVDKTRQSHEKYTKRRPN